MDRLYRASDDDFDEFNVRPRHFLLQKRFEGTRVTVESFLRWKENFDAEMGHKKRQESVEHDGKKLTGRELFMTDKTLNQSDLKFLDDGNSRQISLSLTLATNVDNLMRAICRRRRCCESRRELVSNAGRFGVG